MHAHSQNFCGIGLALGPCPCPFPLWSQPWPSLWPLSPRSPWFPLWLLGWRWRFPHRRSFAHCPGPNRSNRDLGSHAQNAASHIDGIPTSERLSQPNTHCPSPLSYQRLCLSLPFSRIKLKRFQRGATTANSRHQLHQCAERRRNGGRFKVRLNAWLVFQCTAVLSQARVANSNSARTSTAQAHALKLLAT